MVLVSLEGHKLHCVVRFGFKAFNNIAKYKAFLAGLRLAKDVQVKRLLINSDSHLVVSQGNGNFTVKDKSITKYLKQVINLLPSFKKFELARILHVENVHVNIFITFLSKFTSSKDFGLLKAISIEYLARPFISKGDDVMWI